MPLLVLPADPRAGDGAEGEGVMPAGPLLAVLGILLSALFIAAANPPGAVRQCRDAITQAREAGR